MRFSLLSLLSWLALTVIASAGDTIGWKVPLSRYDSYGLEESGAIRLDKPPGPSSFFKEGDELWDFSKVSERGREARKPPLDWLIWNATSGRLVARGAWRDLARLHDMLSLEDLTTMVRLTTRAFEVLPGAPPFSPGGTPSAELRLLTRSGNWASASWNEMETGVDGDFECTSSPLSDWVSARMNLTVSLPGHLAMRVNTQFRLQEGKPLWVARDFDGEKGTDLVVSAEVVLMDGTPASGVVMREKQGKLVPVWPVKDPDGLQQLPDGSWLVTRAVGYDVWHHCIYGEYPKDAETRSDPFAEPSPGDRPEPAMLPVIPEIAPPAILQPWVDHDTLDMRDLIKKELPTIDREKDFAGYNPLTGYLYFVTQSHETASEVSSFFTPWNCGNYTTLVATLGGKGQTRLVADSGIKASLSLGGDDKTDPAFHWEIEPSAADSSEVADIGMSFEDTRNPSNALKLKQNGMTVEVGKPLEILSAGPAASGNKAMSLTVEMIDWEN